MKKILKTFFLWLISFGINATPALNKGDIAFISFSITPGTTNQGFFSLLAKKGIPSGTQIVITNYFFNSTTSGNSVFSATKPKNGGGVTTASGQLTLTFNEYVSSGQSFQINFNGSTVTSTIGIGSASGNLDFGHTDDQDALWIYEKHRNSINDPWVNQIITGMVWKDASNHPGSSILTLGTDFIAFGINGSSTKCGAWQPFSNGTSTPKLNIAPTSSTFFNNNEWTYGTSNWNTCDLTEVNSKLINFITNNLVLTEKYRITPAGSWQTYDGSNWVATTTNWSTSNPDLSNAEVIIQKNTTLSSSNPTFLCGKLTVGDQSISDPITLTVEPGVNLVINTSLDFIPSSTSAKPIIHLKSGQVGGSMKYATLQPTSAVLSDQDGEFKYDYEITFPGWHHLISPISSTFSNIGISGTSPFQFVSGNPGTGNFFYWDPTISQWANGTLSDNFSAKPYTIYVTPAQLDGKTLVLSVQGPLNTYSVNQNTAYNFTTEYHNPTQNGNVPWWGSDDDGWNFYGNPYLSFLSTDTLLVYYNGSTGKVSSNKMTGLNNQIYIWQPDLGQVNPTGTGTTYNDISHYRNRTIAGSNPSGDNQAKFLPPFQAFFMRATSSGSNGHVASKKYRFGAASNITSSVSIINKNLYHEKGNHVLFLFNDSMSIKTPIYVSNIETRKPESYPESDVVLNRVHDCVFGAYYDSTLYKIKYWPTHLDTGSIQVFFEYPEPNVHFQLFPESEMGFLLDRKLNVLHNFELSPYTFEHDTAWNNQVRFQWFFNPNSSLTEAENEHVANNIKVLSSQNGDIIIVSSEPSQMTIFNLAGQEVMNSVTECSELKITNGSLPSGLYVCSTGKYSVKFLIND